MTETMFKERTATERLAYLQGIEAGIRQGIESAEGHHLKTPCNIWDVGFNNALNLVRKELLLYLACIERVVKDEAGADAKTGG